MITKEKIYCANAGDSRAVLYKNENNFSKEGGGEETSFKQSVVALSEDHKPANFDEMKRIVASGHTVSQNRVDGGLAVSRALGDFCYKNQNLNE